MSRADEPQRNTSSVYLPTVRSEFDLPMQAHEAVRSKMLLFATVPRCGSHFICQRFFATKHAGLPLEYFNPAHWNRWRVRIAAEAAGRPPEIASLRGEKSTLADQDTPRASERHTLAALLRRRTGPNGCFSAKLHYSNLEHFTSLLTKAQINHAHWVQIVRHDIIAQAVSWELAAQRGSWIYTQKIWQTPIYDFLALCRRLSQLLRYRHAWDKFFRERGLRPHILYYETFVSDPEGNINAVLDNFKLRGAALTPDIEAALPRIDPIQSQASEINIEWTHRFAEDLGNELEAPTVADASDISIS